MPAIPSMTKNSFAASHRKLLDVLHLPWLSTDRCEEYMGLLFPEEGSSALLTPEQIGEVDRALRLYHRGVYTPDEFSARLGHVARPDNVHEVLQRIPFEFASAVRSPAAAFRPVQGVGYWRSLPKFHDAAN